MKTEGQLRTELRENILNAFIEILREQGEEVKRYKGNAICWPCLDSEQNERWAQLTISIPLGNRDGDAFDGYSAAETYEEKIEKHKREAEEREKASLERKRAREEKRKQREAEKAAKKKK